MSDRPETPGGRLSGPGTGSGAGTDEAWAEFDFIETFLKPLSEGAQGAFGLGDDAALLDRLPSSDQRVIAADMLVEGVHFRSGDPIESVGVKAIAVNYSDLAAMGAEPEYYLLSIAWPRAEGASAAARLGPGLAKGLAEAQSMWGGRLIGGDTVSTPGPLSLSVTAIGRLGAGEKPLRRNAARPGDEVWVSGAIGEAVLGLDALEGRVKEQPGWVGRYQRPQPRLSLGRALVWAKLDCAMDVSDGLAADLGHMARESGVRIEIEAEAVPLGPRTRNWRVEQSDPEAALIRLITGGDDYELVFTAPRHRAEEIERLGDEIGLWLTRIGRVEAGGGVAFRRRDGGLLQIEKAGFTHF